MAFTYPPLTGGQTLFTLATGNTQTDNVIVSGAANKIFTGKTLGGVGGANEIITGANINGVWDSQTQVYLAYTPTLGVTDTISLDGGGNKVVTGKVAGTQLNKANVTVSVSSTLNNGATLGSNNVVLNNWGGTTAVSLTGTLNTIWLNDTALNTVVAGGGGAVVTIAADGSALPLGISNITLGDSGNKVTADDARTTVTGGVSFNTITLGNGDDSVTLTGSNNIVTAGNGDDMVTLGTVALGGNETVTLGNGDNTVTLTGANDSVTAGNGDNTITVKPALLGGAGTEKVVVGNGDNTITVTGPSSSVTVGGGDNTILSCGAKATITIGAANDASSTDFVTLNGVGNKVTAGDENVIIMGGTGAAIIALGNGDDSVTTSGGGNSITLGDGDDSVAVNGNKNTIALGGGAALVYLNTGSCDTVGLGAGNATLTGKGNHNQVSATDTSTDKVTVKLYTGAYNTITLGDGTDNVSDNGATVAITLGNGNDIVAAQGAGDHITAGNGSDTLSAGGANDVITLGNGNDKVTANGAGDTITAGNGNDLVQANGAGDTIVLGQGSDKLTALGFGDKITVNGVNGPIPSVDSIAIGDGTTLTVHNGQDTITAGLPVGSTGGDTITLDHTLVGTVLDSNGPGNFVSLQNDANVTVDNNPSGGNMTLAVNGNAGVYNGTVNINDLTAGMTIDLQGLGYSQYDPGPGSVLDDLYANGNGGWTLFLGGMGSGHGQIVFAHAGGMPQDTNFAFS